MTTMPPPPPGGNEPPDEPYAPPPQGGSGAAPPPPPGGDGAPQPPGAEGYSAYPGEGAGPQQHPYDPGPYGGRGGGSYGEPATGEPYGGSHGGRSYGTPSPGDSYGNPYGASGGQPYGGAAHDAYGEPHTGSHGGGPYEPPGAGGGRPPGGGDYPPGGGGGGPYWPPNDPSGGGGYGAGDPYDPIVAGDFSTWMNRVGGVFKRSWKSIGLLMLIGAVLPSLIVGTVNTSVGPVGDDMTSVDWGDYAGSGAWSLLAWVISGFLAAMAVVGAIRAAVREGTPGVRVPFGESAAYGLKRALPMWGWTILASIVISIGLCACVLPGIYLAIALSVLAPAFVFEGGNPFVRSFKLTHSDFGRALSRMLVAFIAALVYGCVIAIPIGLIEGAVVAGDGGFGQFIVVLILEAIRALLMLPVAIWLVAVVLVTYAELRSRKEGLSTTQLVHEADALGR